MTTYTRRFHAITDTDVRICSNLPLTVENGTVHLYRDTGPNRVREHPTQSPFSARTIWNLWQDKPYPWCVPNTDGTTTTIPATTFGIYMRRIEAEATALLKSAKILMPPDLEATPDWHTESRPRRTMGPIRWKGKTYKWTQTIPFATQSVEEPTIIDWISQWESSSMMSPHQYQISRINELTRRGINHRTMEPI